MPARPSSVAPQRDASSVDATSQSAISISKRGGTGASASSRLIQGRQTAGTTNMMREAALAFLEADENGDGVLDFKEFQVAIHRLRSKTRLPEEDAAERLKSDETRQLRKLFEEIDHDKSGLIEADEYFIWSLDVATRMGCGLEAFFERYDTGGEGTLDAHEFSLAVEDLGFSATFAHDLFLELDDDNSGSISYTELTSTLKERLGSISNESKKFLTTLSFEGAAKWDASQKMEASSGRSNRRLGDGTDGDGHNDDNGDDVAETSLVGFRDSWVNTSTWKDTLVGPDAESLRRQLSSAMRSNSMRDSDLYNLLVMPLVTGDPTQPLTRQVFTIGMLRLGYSGPRKMLVSLYKRIDKDCSGIIGFSELREWTIGRVTRIKAARYVNILTGRTDKATLQTLTWDREQLRRELVAMLQRVELAPLDLVRAWDHSNDLTYSRREFLVSSGSTHLAWTSRPRPSPSHPGARYPHCSLPICLETELFCDGAYSRRS